MDVPEDKPGRQGSGVPAKAGQTIQVSSAAGMVPEMPVGQRPSKETRVANFRLGQFDIRRSRKAIHLDGPAVGGTSGDEGGSGSGPFKGGGTAASNLFSGSTSTASRQANGAKLSPMSGAPNRRSKPSSEPENKQLEPEMLAGRLPLGIFRTGGQYRLRT